MPSTEPVENVYEARFRAFARAEGLREAFPQEVMSEVERWQREPGTDDPALVDWTAIPFVTVDGPMTRDLDQAFYIERAPGGYRLLYAIADASYYLPHGSALLEEALLRGSSFYFPGFSVPMLPRELSEDLVSLNEGALRRALVFEVTLDDASGVTGFKLVRARVRSRRKLTFADVEALVEDRGRSPLAKEPFAESLRLFLEVGERRTHHPDRQQMIHYRRVEAEVRLLPTGGITVALSGRGPAELATEQISILCNALGGRFLMSGDPEAIQPIYRVHSPPLPARTEAFERLVGAVARTRGLPDDPWVYRRAAESGLAGYLDALPTEGAPGRLAKALHRQAMLLNGRSMFASDPSAHYGVGEPVYSRFTAPMREMVGVFCHKEATERMGVARSRPRAEDEALRERVIECANASKTVQRRIDREGDRAVLGAVVTDDLARPFDERPLRRGTVMGIDRSSVHVLLDDLPIDVRVPFKDQGALLGGAWLSSADDGARLVVDRTKETVCHLGDEVSVRAKTPEACVLVKD